MSNPPGYHVVTKSYKVIKKNGTIYGSFDADDECLTTNLSHNFMFCAGMPLDVMTWNIRNLGYTLEPQ